MKNSDAVLVTGAAGFIGFHLCQKLCSAGLEVFGIDNLNDYYDIKLKETRLALLTKHSNFQFQKVDIADAGSLARIFESNRFQYVVNLAAQAGVRYSLTNPYAYVQSNLVGFVNILEQCRHSKVKHLVYASSSSVYGGNKKMPFSTRDNVDHPLSLYAATKKSNELMAHTYSSLYGVPTTGLRFFTVYGPYGRPDMALYMFTRNILAGEPIEVFNNGDMKRDFTYVDDIVEGIFRVIFKPAAPDVNWSGQEPNPGSSFAPYKVYNIGNSDPVPLLSFINAIEKKLAIKAKIKLLPLQPGDVPETCADTRDLEQAISFRPNTSIDDGISRFIDWYKQYYKVK